MRPSSRLTFIVFFLAAAPSAAAQSAREIEDEYHYRVRIAAGDSAQARDFVMAAEAARFMRRFDEAAEYLDWAETSARDANAQNAILRERLNQHLATGSSLAEMQGSFSAARGAVHMPALVVAGWINAFPELLIGGEYDDLIGRLSEDAEDPDEQCACFAQKAWMHRVAGRIEDSRIYWDSLNTSWTRQPQFTTAFDEADWLAARARNLARAGKFDEARAQLGRAMEVQLSAFESVSILRRRAQTYAELGEVGKAVADLEALLTMPSPVTPHTIRLRVTWDPIRDHPAFRALLERHPVE